MTEKFDKVEHARQQIAETIDNQGFSYAIMEYGDYLQSEAKEIPGTERLIELFQSSTQILRELRKELEKHDCIY